MALRSVKRLAMIQTITIIDDIVIDQGVEMSRKARKRFNRRDRRKAKESGFRRPGRSNPRKVAHGGSGQVASGVNEAIHKKRGIPVNYDDVVIDQVDTEVKK